MFLLGDVFLRNFYSVYNMDSNTVSFGVDIQAQDYSSMVLAPQSAVVPFLIMSLSTIFVSLIVIFFCRRWSRNRMNKKVTLLESKKFGIPEES